jgi:hypothetical protein
MRFVVREMPKAKSDKLSIFTWLRDHSPAGAVAWLDAYDELVERLQRDADSHGVSPESADCDREIRQAFFKTRRGRTYRALYIIERGDVYILRVRGPGQAPVTPDEIV